MAGPVSRRRGGVWLTVGDFISFSFRIGCAPATFIIFLVLGVLMYHAFKP